MKNKSKMSYRIYFIIINFLFSIIGCAYLMILFIKTEKQNLPLFLSLLAIWNFTSSFLALKLFKDDKTIEEDIIYDENYRRKVQKYRNAFNTSFTIFLASFALIIINIPGYFPEKIIYTLFPIFLFVGIISLFITIFYFSGSKNISANEIVVYPFQFINDPAMKRQLIEKKIKQYTRSIYIIPIIFITLYFLDIFDVKTLLYGFILGTSSIPYKIKQYKSMIN